MKRGEGHEVPPGAREASPSVSPLHQLEGALQKPVAFLIVPIFGFTNAGVSFTGVTAATLIEPFKDQRDQDQRRHEQQVQQVQAELRQQQLVLVKKQDELTRLNQEGARPVLELSHTKQSRYEQLTPGRRLEQAPGRPGVETDVGRFTSQSSGIVTFTSANRALLLHRTSATTN